MGLQLLVSGISMGCIYAMIGLAFNLIFNATKIFNFGQGEFLMLGTMFILTLFARWELPLAASLPLVILGVAAIAWLFERAFIAHLRKKQANVIMMIMACLAFSVIAQNVAQAIWGPSTFPVPNFLPSDVVSLRGVVVRSQELVIMVTTLVLLLFFWWFFQATMVGKGFRACSIREDTAQLCGVNVKQMVTLAFVLSGGVSGLAGAVVSPVSYASATVGVYLGIIGFCAAVVGGMGNPVGAVLGGLFIGIVESMWAGYVSPGTSPIVAFLAMLLVVYVRPTGIMGSSIPAFQISLFQRRKGVEGL